MDNFHTPVLLTSVVDNLNIKSSGKYIDGTIGGGGHAAEILKRSGMVLGIDQDKDAILHLKKKFESEIKKGQLVVVHDNFANIEKIAQNTGFGKVDGILLDLGVSSNQIDHSGRGFSFRRDEPLDMRMDADSELTAQEIVNTGSQDELYEIFAKYGEENAARRIAQEIVTTRAEKEIKTSLELAKIIESVVKPSGKLNPSTKVFQALRIYVNSEIDNLRQALESGFKLLNEGAKFEVISFHSLEDRAVKLYFLKLAREGRAHLINKKPIIATDDETTKNRRSRSAKLRVLEKTNES